MALNRGAFTAYGLTPPLGKLGHSLPSAYKFNSPESTSQPVFGRHPSPIAKKCLNLSSGEVKDAPNAQSVAELTDGVVDLHVNDAYGTPSYPAVLDHIRGSKQQQETEAVRSSSTEEEKLRTKSPEVTIEKFRGDGMNDVSFAQGYTRGSFLPTSDDPQRPASALSQSWRFHSFVGNAEIGVLFPTTIRNPNKALVTVDGNTRILIANEMACELFSYTQDRLVGMKLKELFASPFREKQESVIEEQIDGSGKTVMVNGKVVDAVDSMGATFPISMWMKKVAEEPETRCIVVLEPVERTAGLIYLDANGCVVTCDETFLHLSGYTTKEEVVNKLASDFIPAFQLPSEVQEMKDVQATGRTKDGVAFPLSLAIRRLKEQKFIDGKEAVYKVLVWVFANISGLVSFQAGGRVVGINENYARLMFGYSAAEIQGKDMSFLIPNFFLEVANHLMDSSSIALPPFDCDESLPPAHTVHIKQKTSLASTSLESINTIKSTSSSGVHNTNSLDELQRETDIKPRDDSGVASAPTAQQQDGVPTEGNENTTKQKEKEVSFSDNIKVSNQEISPETIVNFQTPETLTSSTPARPSHSRSSLPSHSPVPRPFSPPHTHRSSSTSPSHTVMEGSYVGYARHKDGSSLPIVFDVKRVDLDNGGQIYCVWVSRNLVEGRDGSRIVMDWTLGATMDGSDRHQEASMVSAYTDAIESLDSCPYISVGSPGTLEEVTACRGEYGRMYNTLKSIGKGAFGFVKLAERKADKQMVVVKFIRKSRVLDECWINVPDQGRMPLEIHLLTTLSHSNIVKIIDVFDNEEFYQMVMEKHGDGMDLFEFIDRQPAIDEALESYIFRQVVAAVGYLHSLNVTHRDIKDENIIIDRQFTCKLIDFGSAAFMEKGKLFGTFCGTMEYCAPEVLLGNRYAGPQLECWSLGVTLYTLVFGENPFFDVEESIQARFQPPFAVSAALTHLLMWVLHPEPRARATIRDMEGHRWVRQQVNLHNYKWEMIVPQPMTGPSQTESVMLEMNPDATGSNLDDCIANDSSDITPVDTDDEHMEGPHNQPSSDDVNQQTNYPTSQ